MPVKTDVRVEGLAELKRQFRRLDKSSRRKTLRKVLRKAGRPVIVQARKNLKQNRDTGRLEKAIAQSVRAEHDTRVFSEIGFRKKSFYGMFIELGTAFQPPRPWLRPALSQMRVKVVGIIGASLKAEFMRIARSGR